MKAQSVSMKLKKLCYYYLQRHYLNLQLGLLLFFQFNIHHVHNSLKMASENNSCLTINATFPLQFPHSTLGRSLAGHVKAKEL